MSFTEIKSCLACGHDELIPTLDLGVQPLANSYTKTKDEILPEFPLAVNRCAKCHHVQLSVAVDPDLMFKDYLYVSGTSRTMLEYFTWFAKYTKEYFEMLFPNTASDISVLDIGCNDGSQLDKFKDIGCVTQGIDPAENLHVESSKRHDIVCGYFDETTIGRLNKPNIITAQNVFAHNFDPLAFMKNAESLMASNTLFFIQTSQANMILNNEFDTIYHEHVNFFNIKSMKLLCERAGLNLIDVIKTPLHGTSYVFVISKSIERNAHIDNLIKMEEVAGLYTDSTYDKYRETCEGLIYNLNYNINLFRGYNYKVIGYGAAAKGNTLLNYAKLKLDYIIDDNPLKHNHFTPGTQSEIVSLDILDQYSSQDKILFVPLAWNFFDEIKGNIKRKRDIKEDRFLMYFPSVKYFSE